MSHYYTITGDLVAQVPMSTKPGEFRDTDLRDAKKLSLFPSVTTVQQLLAKPELIVWQAEQIVRAVMANPPLQDEATPAYIKRMRLAADEKRDRAANEGIQIHAAIHKLLKGQALDPVADGILAFRIAHSVIDYMDEVGMVCEGSEITFVNQPFGYAGTADFIGTLNGKPIIVDFKTREWEEGENPVFYEPEYPIQLAGYAAGLNLPDHHRMSLLINRLRPQSFASKPWNEASKWPAERADAAWFSLLHTWKELRGYWPELLRGQE